MTPPGTLIAGRYRLVNQIAVGGMGSVWEGWDEVLQRRVAVKQLLPQPGLSPDQAILARNRVIREARITARLHHPNAVTLYDVVEEDAAPCLIMQYVQSQSLSAVLQERGSLEPAYVARIGAELASALAAAHAVGIVHRDVKPGNVLISPDGSAKLTDFGISHADGDVTVTLTGMVTGTPAYLAPEVARGGRSSFSADVFSLGATVYAALEGTPPYGNDPNPMAILHRVASGQMRPPVQSGSLTPLILQMMAANPVERPTMTAVAGEMSAYRPEPETQAESTLEIVPHQSFRPDPAARRSPAPPTPETLSAAVLGTSAPPSVATPPPVPASGSASAPSPSPTPSPSPSPSPDVREPDDPPAQRRPTRALLIAISAIVLAAAVVIGVVLLRSADSGGTAGSPTSASEQSTGSETTASTESTATESTETSETEAESESATTASTAVTGTPTPAQLAAAITEYYALMPAGTDEGWNRLTANFQTGIAQNREYYQSFWDGVQSVTASDVTGESPGTATATITYTFKDGSTSVENTAYDLVLEDGVLKIDNSTVLN